MIDLSLALELRSAGLTWRPADGDRFAVTRTEMLDDVFHLADMVVEARRLETGTIFAFNGTTEWALDSVDAARVLWLPREDQLRAQLGDAFNTLTAVPGGFVVTLTDGTRHLDIDAERAYARAVLHVLGGS